MRRPRSGQDQLELEWTSAMQWADLPVGIRDRIREHLADLLRQAATRRGADERVADE
jgi:hypothetical protein